jgi:kynurenine formamidase
MPVGPAETFPPFRVSAYRTPRNLHDPSFQKHDYSMEIISAAPHVGTHIDAFAHIQSDGRVYGGHAVADAYGDWGWQVNGIENTPPILTRALILDMPPLLGFAKALPDGFEITVDHVRKALDTSALSLRDGDAVLLRTGKFAADYIRDASAFFGPQPGIGPAAAIWLHEQGMALLGSDTSATEAFPFPDPTRTTHRAMLVEHGVHLVEILDLEAITNAGVRSCLFVCLPLRIRGATGSWVRPIAVE